MLRAWTQFVQRLCQCFLAGAALAQQQYRDMCSSKLLDVSANLQHGLAGGDDTFDWRPCRHRSQPSVFILEPVQIEAAIYDRSQHLDLDGFLAEIIGTE